MFNVFKVILGRKSVAVNERAGSEVDVISSSPSCVSLQYLVGFALVNAYTSLFHECFAAEASVLEPLVEDVAKLYLAARLVS